MEEASGPDVEVWPEHMQPLRVLEMLGTQWRAGMGGATGLDYSAIPTVLRLAGIPRKEWADLFDDLRVMEQAALGQMHKESNKPA